MAEPQDKKYRRPDGTTYRQYGGPKSRQDVEVPEPAASPSTPPAASPSTDVTQTKSGARTSTEVVERSLAEAAQRAVEDVETTEKVAPWLLEKPTVSVGGLGGASERARARLKKVHAESAGDALAEDEEKKKKKKEGY